MTELTNTNAGTWVVYPTHGVGQIQGTETEEIAGLKMEFLVIEFTQNRLTVRLPMARAKTSGLRPIADKDTVKKALGILKGKSSSRRVMWARRAQEYDAKINSGDLLQAAEVLRDLARVSVDPDQSFSERQLYENALARLSLEMAALENIDPTDATAKVEKILHQTAA